MLVPKTRRRSPMARELLFFLECAQAVPWTAKSGEWDGACAQGIVGVVVSSLPRVPAARCSSLGRHRLDLLLV